MRDIEIRVGNASFTTNSKGKIINNVICGVFKGPGDSGEDYTILCKQEVLADYVSIQILDDKATLQINQLRLETSSKGIFI